MKLLLRLLFFSFFCAVAGLSYAQECGIFYVTPGGAGSGAPGTVGTRATPCNLNYALTNADATQPLIRMAAGTYSLDTAVVLKDSVMLDGGYLPGNNWAKSNTDSTILARSAAGVLPNPARVIAVMAMNARGFRLNDLFITVADATQPQVSNYGLYLNSCRDYVVNRVRFAIGDAGDGQDGTDGTDGTDGADGANGQVGCWGCAPSAPPNSDGGAGGDSWSAGAAAGGAGGDGGAVGSGTDCDFLFVPCPNNDLCDPASISAPNGTDGTDGNSNGVGQGIFPGSFGNGKNGVNACSNAFSDANDVINFLNGCPAQNNQPTYYGDDGQPGDPGTDGTDGTDGTVAFAGGFFVPGDGTDGTDGLDGAGGGGGGGGASLGGMPGFANAGDVAYPVVPALGGSTEPNSSGGGGGGGGEGGQGGTGGTAGTGGGAAFGVFLWDNGPNGVIKDSPIVMGQPGAAGQGGLRGLGGTGGDGGQGGNDLLLNGNFGSGCQSGAGGNGGDGGDGGDGGNGGDGSEGLAQPVYTDPAGDPVIVSNNYQQLEAKITVYNTGCSNQLVSVVAEDNATNVFWSLNGIPNSAIGDSVTTRYDTTGIYTVSVNLDGIPYTYTDFVLVPNPFDLPQIDASSPTVCTGGSINFGTQATGDTYNWSFPGGTPSSSTQQNPGAVTFNNPGQYTVEFFTTSCCGQSIIDTLVVNVIDNVPVSLPQDDTICQPDPRPELDANFLPGGTYSWTLNGNPLPDTTAVLTTDDAGLYEFTLTYPGGCSGSDDFNLTITDSLELDLGPDIGICQGDPLPLLQPGLSANNTFFWTKNGQPVGTNTFLQTNGPGTYGLLLTNPYGCFGFDELEVIQGNPVVNLGPDVDHCLGSGPLELDAQNPGASYNWTSGGTQVGTNQTFEVTTSGTYAVEVTDPAGCTASDTISVTVGSPVTADFQLPPAIVAGQPFSFTDNTTPTPQAWFWDFGDGNTSTDQNPTHTYTAPGQYPVYLIAYDGICQDTHIVSLNVEADCASLNLQPGFSFSPNPVDLGQTGSVQFTNTSSGADAYNWDFGDGNSSSAFAPTHVYANAGEYVVTLTASVQNCTAEATDTVTVFRPMVSRPEQADGLPIVLYPNPSNGELYLELPQSLTAGELQLVLRTLEGRSVPATTEQLSPHKVKLSVNTGFAAGTYLLEVIYPEGRLTHKILLQP